MKIGKANIVKRCLLISVLLGFVELARAVSPAAIDLTFDAAAARISTVFDLVVLADGKILVAGVFTNDAGTNVTGVMRLYADGSPDTNFVSGTGAVNTNSDTVSYPPQPPPPPSFSSLALLPDGRCLVAGQFTGYNGEARNGLVCLTTNGTLDVAYNGGLGVPAHVTSIAVDTNQMVLLCGAGGVQRLQSDGTFDATFSPWFSACCHIRFGGVSGVKLLPDGKILAYGDFTIWPNGGGGGIAKSLSRLASDGSQDPGFFPIFFSGFTQYPIIGIADVAVRPNGKIVVVGSFSSGVMQLTSDGAPDGSFDPGQGLTPNAGRKILVQDNDSALILGGFNQFDGHPAPGIFRVLANGNWDSSFRVGWDTASLGSMAFASDWRFYLSGNLGSPNPLPGRHLFRLFANKFAHLESVGAGGQNQFSFMLFETNASNVIIQSKPSLSAADWVSVATNLLTNGQFRFSESIPGGDAARFYRGILTK